MTAALPFPIVARPLPAAALYRRLRALAGELALLTAQAADRARDPEAANLETLAEIYVEDARLFGQLAAEADTAPRLAIIPLHPEERPQRSRPEGDRTPASLSPVTREDAAAAPVLSMPTGRGAAAACSGDGASGGDAA